jgi:membrane protein YqaA with SNARE-associated domain
VNSLSTWIIGLVASPIGVMVLAALDSTLFLAVPGGIDAAVMMLAARRHTMAWIVALLATTGSVAGAALTFWMGIKIGAHELERYIAPRRLTRIREKARNLGAIGLAVLDLIPPPFPFTAFILAAGALEVDGTTFFVTLTICRAVRFGAEAALAVIYGRRILMWIGSDLFHDIVVVFSLLAIALTLLSVVKLAKSSRTPRRSAAA